MRSKPKGCQFLEIVLLKLVKNAILFEVESPGRQRSDFEMQSRMILGESAGVVGVGMLAHRREIVIFMITSIICTGSCSHQSPFLSLGLSNRCFNLSRALSPGEPLAS